MGESRRSSIDRKLKFAPDPASPLDVVEERLRQAENEIRMLRQSMQLTTLHAFDRAPYIDATQGEVLWDFQFQRGYIYHHGKWRPLAPPTYHIKVFSDDEDVDTEHPFKFMVSRDMGGWTSDVEDAQAYPDFYLYDAEAYVTTAGACTVEINNNTQGNNMLSSPLVIASLNDTGTRVIHPVNSVVAWHDHIWIEVTSPGGMGLGVKLVFNPVID